MGHTIVDSFIIMDYRELQPRRIRRLRFRSIITTAVERYFLSNLIGGPIRYAI